MATKMYKGKVEATVPDGRVKHYEALGYTTEKPAEKKSRSKPPATEEGSNNGED